MHRETDENTQYDSQIYLRKMGYKHKEYPYIFDSEIAFWKTKCHNLWLISCVDFENNFLPFKVIHILNKLVNYSPLIHATAVHAEHRLRNSAALLRHLIMCIFKIKHICKHFRHKSPLNHFLQVLHIVHCRICMYINIK